MLRDIQCREICLGILQHAHELLMRFLRRPGILHNDISLVDKKVLIRCLYSAFFPAGHRMPRDIIHILRQNFLQMLPEILFGTSCIRKDRTFFQIR